ncbi:MAG TPA: lipopolysaccharide kinase InaA family protein [Gemmatimonadaceae bacterium]
MRIGLPGYARLSSPRARGITLESCRDALESILATETVYDFAARQPNARKFTGRATVYAIELPGECGRAVVRRSMRGGWLAALNTDLFLPPTRAVRELIISLRLRSAGVATPEVIAFAVYRAGAIFRRSDVITREIQGKDLLSILAADGSAESRSESLEAAAVLVASLSRAGAHHSDLNVRNILVASGVAYILDVDRIRFHVPGDPIVLRANIERLERSLRKRRDLDGLTIDEREIAGLVARVIELAK